MRQRELGRRGVRATLVVVLLGLATLVAPPAALALPTASFTVSPASPVVGEVVTFTFTGTCDAPPCRIQWRWYRDDGSPSGTAMGEGEQVEHVFARPGEHRVVARITGAGSTHGSASATQVVSVEGEAPPPPTPPVAFEEDDPAVRLDGWRSVASVVASAGSHHRGRGSAALRFTGDRIDYVAVTGPGLGIVAVRLDDRSPRMLDLWSRTTARRSWTFRAPRGPHRLEVWSTGRRSGASTGTAVTLDEVVVGSGASSVLLDDASLRLTYGRWAGVRSSAASGGAERVTRTPGAWVRVAFSGPRLAWLTATGPGEGRARVTVDGVLVAVVDNRTPGVPARHVVRHVTGLPDGPHHAQITMLPDPRGPSRLTVDAFVAAGRALRPDA